MTLLISASLTWSSRYSALKDVSPPPYAPRQRPSAVDRQPGPSVKAGRRESNLGFVKFYEKPEFPWHTEYAGEAAKAWDDSIYSQSRTAHLEAVQHRNAAIIAKHDLTKKAGDEDREYLYQDLDCLITNSISRGTSCSANCTSRSRKVDQGQRKAQA